MIIHLQIQINKEICVNFIHKFVGLRFSLTSITAIYPITQ